MPDPVRDHAVIELRGELDIPAAAALGALLSAAMARTPVIEVDLSPRHPYPAVSLPYWRFRWTV